eukprot:snap_masked-scaffold_6-processed-gene-9.16-mRNA-1 protein AED:1.00 eAED:1.00 QI:0/0/0/0/1/1/2/0/82
MPCESRILHIADFADVVSLFEKSRERTKLKGNLDSRLKNPVSRYVLQSITNAENCYGMQKLLSVLLFKQYRKLMHSISTLLA